MAKIRNLTGDVLSLFRADAPPIQPGDEITVRDEVFVERAWPKSTWEVTEPPVGHKDASTEDAYLFIPAEVAEDKPARKRAVKTED